MKKGCWSGKGERRVDETKREKGEGGNNEALKREGGGKRGAE